MFIPNESVAQALEAVRKMGSADNKEHLIALKEDGSFKFLVHGGDHEVSFENEDMTGVTHIIHNHPIGAALSAQDIGMATARGVTVMCITPSGSVFKSRGTKAQPEDRGTRNEEDSKLNVAYSMMGGERRIGHELMMRQALGIGNEVHANPNVLVSHFVNMIFADGDLLDYEFSLSEEERKVYEQHQNFFNKRAGHNISLLG